MEHSFNIYLAQEIGVPQSIFLKNIHFWIDKNKANGSNKHEDKTWTFNSVKAFCQLFPYFSEKQIRTITEKVESAGFVEVGCFNKINYDKTKWYTLTQKYYDLYAECLNKEAKSLCPNGQMDMTKKANGYDHKGKSNRPKRPTYTIYKPNKNTDNKAVDKMEVVSSLIKKHLDGEPQDIFNKYFTTQSNYKKIMSDYKYGDTRPYHKIINDMYQEIIESPELSAVTEESVL